MPQIGKPFNPQAAKRQQAFRSVGMAPPQNSRPGTPIAEGEKERLLNKLTGYKPKNDLVVDGKKHNQLGKDEFLKLLSAQLKNQDPLDPMKQDKMAAELAQFSSLEQLTNLNKKFENFNKNDKIEEKFYGASFLGKEVVTSGSSMKFEGEGTTADILFTLDKPASKVLVRVFDSNNNMMSEIWKENIGRGNQTVTWDGYQMDKTIAGKGDYKTQVIAWDEFSQPMEVKTKNTGIVESVFFENGETILKVDGKKVFLRDVDSFHTAKQGGNKKGVNNPARSKFQQTALQQGIRMQANNAAKNLPVATQQPARVNLNRAEKYQAYQSEPSTGITSVYDE